MKIAIVGAGTFSLEAAWVAERAGYEIAGYCDDDPAKAGTENGGKPVFGTVEQAPLPAGTGFLVAVGNCKVREDLFHRAESRGWVPATVVSPSAVVAANATIGPGCFIGDFTLVSVNASIGKGVLVNSHCNVGHDAMIGDFAMICPCAGLTGGSRVGRRSVVGTNACMMPYKSIGDDAVLGMGAALVCDMPDGQTLVGPSLVRIK